MKEILFLLKLAAEQLQEFLNLSATITYMENHYLENIPLDKLAKIACMSPRQFGRVFKHLKGTSPIEYLIGLRIEHACYLLQNSSYSITDISAMSGFSDSNYFTRVFKNKTR